MAITLNGTTGISTSGGYTGDGVSFADGTPSNTLVTTTGGNVGVGTAAPVGKLSVATTSSTGAPTVWSNGQFLVSPGGTATSTGFGISVDTTNNVSYITSLTPGAAWRTLGYRANEHIFYSIGTTEAARINSAGVLLVGTVNSTTNEKVRIYSTSGYTLASSRTGTGSETHVLFENGNGGVGNIVTSGTSTSYNTSSDYRLKENIEPMTGALERVLGYRPVTYTWKADGSIGRGYIAHWLQEDGGEGAVTGEKDAVDADGNPQYQGIDTSFLVTDLNGAIKEMHEIIVEQQALITQLQADVDALKGATP